MTHISFRPRALDGLKIAPRDIQTEIQAAIDVLEQGAFPPHTKKLGGRQNGYRTRVGRWRILFVLKDGEIEIIDIFLKKERGDYGRRG